MEKLRSFFVSKPIVAKFVVNGPINAKLYYSVFIISFFSS